MDAVAERRAKGRIRSRRIKVMFYAIVSAFVAALWLTVPFFIQGTNAAGEADSGGPFVWAFYLLILLLFIYLAYSNSKEFRQLGGPDAHLVQAPKKRGFSGAPAGFVIPFWIVTSLGVGGALVAGAAAFSVASKGAIAQMDAQLGGLWENWGGWIGAGVGLIAGVIFAAFSWDRLTASFCPKCQRYWVAQAVSRQHVGSSFGTSSSRETIVTRDRFNSPIAYTNVPVQKQHVTETYEVHCRCTNCGHEWNALRRLTRPA